MTNSLDQSKLSWLNSELSTGKMSRRDFLNRGMALGVSATVASSFVMSPLLAAEPKKGGRLKLAMGHGSTSDTIDPATLVNGYQWALGYAVRDTLMEVGPGR